MSTIGVSVSIELISFVVNSSFLGILSNVLSNGFLNCWVFGLMERYFFVNKTSADLSVELTVTLIVQNNYYIFIN